LKKRHIAKTITWRIIGTLDTFIIGWIVTGNELIGASIGGLEIITKTILYYIHERAWYKSKYGTSIHEIKNKTKWTAKTVMMY